MEQTKQQKAKVTILREHNFYNSAKVFEKKLIKFNTYGIPFITYQRLFWELMKDATKHDEYVTTGRVQLAHSGTEFGNDIEKMYLIHEQKEKKEAEDKMYISESGKQRFDIIIGSSLHPKGDLLLRSKKVMINSAGKLYIRHNRHLYVIEPNFNGKSDFITIGQKHKI